MTTAFLTLAALCASSDDAPGIMLPRDSDPLFRACVEHLAAADADAVGEIVGRMPVRCSYCSAPYSEKPCAPAMHGLTSHGICPACFVRHFPDCARRVRLARAALSPAMKTQIAHANVREALPSRRVCQELGSPAQRTVRARAASEMEFGVHWIWRHGEEHYTPAGLRLLAEAHDRESDTAAAVVCRRLADEIEAAAMRGREHFAAGHAAPTPAPEHVAVDREADTYAMLEARGLA